LLKSYRNGAPTERRSAAILVQLTDYTGLVKEQTPPQWAYSHLQNVKILPPLLKAGTQEDMGTYWQILAFLVRGSAGLRVLPYSDGYGFRHSNPTVVRKASRYGYFDVDTMTELPDLRPGYNDQLLWSVVRHDLLNLVRHLLCEKKWKLETR